MNSTVPRCGAVGPLCPFPPNTRAVCERLDGHDGEHHHPAVGHWSGSVAAGFYRQGEAPPPKPIVPLVDPPSSHAYNPIGPRPAGLPDGYKNPTPCRVCGFSEHQHNASRDAELDAWEARTPDPLPVFGPPAHVPTFGAPEVTGPAPSVTPRLDAYLEGYRAGMDRATELLHAVLTELRGAEVDAMARDLEVG